MKKTTGIALILFFLLTFLSSCSPKSEQSTTIRIAVLPVLDTLPLYVAEAQGYFVDEGLDVELVPVSSAPERDQLMHAGQIDAMLNEIVSTLFYNQQSTQIRIVRFARTATAQYPIFRILASADSGITSVEQLVGVPVGVSDGTVIAYTTDRILQHAGLLHNEITTLSVPKIPDRMALLSSGELQAANLPDPVASLAMLDGAVLVIDDTSYPEVSNSVISFSVDFLENNPKTVSAFLRAYEKAVHDINQDKLSWIPFLLENELLPPPLAETYILPDYPTASVPTADQFQDAANWAMDKGLLDLAPSYSDSVTDDFLQQ
ncbi:MAG: ABC transporter substrate-binding protein [Anaerolineales bacterium]|nr:ABC transporter substrate-binding protein [Anaerolineales bacterium]